MNKYTSYETQWQSGSEIESNILVLKETQLNIRANTDSKSQVGGLSFKQLPKKAGVSTLISNYSHVA